MRIRTYCWVSVLTVLVLIIWRAPAAWLNHALAQATRGKVQLVQAWGTVWQGEGTLRLERSTTEFWRMPEPVVWQINTAALWQGRIEAQLMLQGKPLQVHHTGWGDTAQLRVSQGQYQLPAHSLNSLGAPFNTLKLAGELSLQWPAFELPLKPTHTPFARIPPLTVDIQSLKSAISGNQLLGNYRLKLSPLTGDNTKLALTILTPSPKDALQLNGQGQLSPNGSVQFELRSRPSDENQRERLQSILNMLGRREGIEHLLRL